MGRYIKEIVDFICDFDNGLNLEKDDSLLIISSDTSLTKAFINRNNIFTVSPVSFTNDILNINDKSIDYIVIDSSFNNFDAQLLRITLRAKLRNHFSEVIIVEDNVQLNQKKIETLFAGSWYRKKEIPEAGSDNLTLYYNPLGYDLDEMNSKEITEFIKSCEDYCNVIENYENYSVKDFLLNIQKFLVNYYLKGFGLQECNGSNGNTEISTEYTKKNVDDFFLLANKLLNFLGKHNLYWSNFNPYPDDNDIEVYEHSLAGDLAEIYEDIKLNCEAFKKGNIYDKQEMLWQFKFDWQGHTGDHWTFAVRAIHWKLQDLEYDE